MKKSSSEVRTMNKQGGRPVLQGAISLPLRHSRILNIRKDLALWLGSLSWRPMQRLATSPQLLARNKKGRSEERPVGNAIGENHGRAMVTGGETHVSMSVALPSAFCTVMVTVYVPFGTWKVLLPLKVPPSHEKAKNPVAVVFRGR